MMLGGVFSLFAFRCMEMEKNRLTVVPTFEKSACTVKVNQPQRGKVRRTSRRVRYVVDSSDSSQPQAH